MIHRRHVFYVEGYDPQGAVGYSRLFKRELRRFRNAWPVTVDTSELTIDSDELAHWTVETKAPNWTVHTRYEFLRLEAVIGANLAKPLWRQVVDGVGWALDDLFSGTTARLFRASWRFALHLVYPQVMTLLWIVLALGVGWAVARELPAAIAMSPAVSWPLGAVAAIAVFLSLRPLADRLFVTRINSAWANLRPFAHGAASPYDRAVEVLAHRLVATAEAADCDEILLIGHSAGSLTGLAIMARALELDPALGRRGPAVVYLTVGSLIPGFGLHPKAARVRDAIARLAVEPAVRWIDCQSRKDVMNFWDFDPVADIGIDVGPQRCNPLIWIVRFRDMLESASYRRIRGNLFRLHYQFIMGNDLRAPYDYYMLVCGPLSVSEWASRGAVTLQSFAGDGSLTSGAANARDAVSPRSALLSHPAE